MCAHAHACETFTALDPLLIGDVAFGNGFSVNLINFHFYGISQYKVDKVSISPYGQNVKIMAILLVPRAMSRATYTMDWKLGILNLRGNGKTTAEYGELKYM